MRRVAELGSLGIMRYYRPGPTSRSAAILKGAAIGFLVGLASVATIDKKSLAILRVIGKPVEWTMWVTQKLFGLSDGSTALMGWLGMGVWCMILGGLIGWGISKATGDE